MTGAGLREPELRAQVQGVLDKVSGVRAIAFRALPKWDGPAAITVGGATFDVAACVSALAVREHLAAERADDRGLVLLADCDDAALGGDVLARIAKHRLLPLDRWSATRVMFGAREIDPALSRLSWLADALLRSAPADGYAKVPSGVLDEDTAWQAFLSTHLGLSDRKPGLSALLQWSRQPTAARSFADLEETARDAVLGYWAAAGGKPAETFGALVRSGRVADAVPVGLVLGIVHGPWEADDLPRQAVAKDRLRAWFGDGPVEGAVVRRYADETERSVRRWWSQDGLASVRPLLARAGAILSELAIGDEAHRSDLLLASFDQRRVRLGAAIEQALGDDGRIRPGALDAVEATCQLVLAHERLRTRDRDADPEPIEMALRLGRWLDTEGAGDATSCAAAALRYASEGAFVDRARDALRRGGEAPEALNAAFRRLVDAVTVRRAAENRRFAELLAEWSKVPAVQDDAAVPMEDVLDEVVKPLASEQPVLLLVVDGMSLAVYEELVDDLERLGFRELRNVAAGRRMVALAALPTRTEVCRTTLLSGRLQQGRDETERKSFEGHAGLGSVSAAKLPPILFHKASLTGAGGIGLAEKVRSEVAGKRQIVGVVLNAVDDHLLKGDQVRARWYVDTIKPLGALLDAAREGNRLVIVTSDHGHVLHNEADYRESEEGGERFRIATGDPAPDEVLLTGPRVLGADAIYAPWSDSARYAAKRNGYHGGATLQEVVVPIGVWASADVEVSGWMEAASPRPAWWDRTPAREATATPTPPTRPKRKSKEPQQLLFEVEATASLVDQLFRSKVYAEQKKLAGRAGLPEDKARQIVEALESHGGKLLRPALCRQVDLSAIRLNGLLTQLRKVLNVDGYDVLSIDAESDTVSLDESLLVVQFELKGR